MEFNAQNVEYAVSVFYNGEQADRANAHTWLTTAQRVPEAWTFLWELLQPTKATEVQFYAATTLHTKILRCWNEVPPEIYEQLKEKILHAIFTYANGPKIVTNRLCISLAAYILQQGTTDLATILRPLSNVENPSLLLEVLTVIPEEYDSMTMGSVLRNKNRAALKQACPAVLDDMLRYLQTANNDFSKQPPSEELILSWTTAATCAASWLTIEGDDVDFGPPLPERLPLIRALLTVVHILYNCNEIVSDTSLDACEACLSAARAACTSSDADRQPNAGLEVLACLASLAGPIMAKDNVPNSPNEELLSSLITCCVAVGETHARALVEAVEKNETSEQVLRARGLLDVLLEAQGAPGKYPAHETRSNLVFGVWYTLQDEIIVISERNQEINPIWREMFVRLLKILIQKSEALPDSMLSKDDLELFRCYRQDISDTVMFCFGVLGDCCWSVVCAEYEGASAGAGAGGCGVSARREAALHVFLALEDGAGSSRAPLALLRYAERQARNPDSPRALATALHCLAAYGAWLAASPLPAAAHLARECLAAAGDALPCAPHDAALALRKLCADCPQPAAQLAPDIVAAAQNSRGQDAWTRRQLLGAAGAALAAAEPEVATPLLRELAATLHDDLAEQARSGGGEGCAAEWCAALLGALGARPALAADLLRALAPTLPLFAHNPVLVEPMFGILKQAVTAFMGNYVPLVEDISHLTIAAFECYPCAAGLYVIKLVCIAYGGEWGGCSALVGAGVGASARALVPQPAAHPDLAEGLFALLHALTKKRPACLDCLEDSMLDLVDLGRACIRLWEAGAARAACAWLAALAAVRPHALRPRAPHLVADLLTCIGGATPRNQIDPLAEVVLALNRASWGAGEQEGLAGWLRNALAAPAFPTPHATDATKHKFMAAVVKEKSSKRRLLDTVREFSLVCRGLIGTEYARQCITSKQLIA